MTTRWTLTFDCSDAPALAAFWIVALGYVEKAPPEGWATWDEWLTHWEVPPEEWHDGAAIDDPHGQLPAISFLRVPEQRTAKNRLHLDLQVSGGRHVDQALRVERIEAMVRRLEEAGGQVLSRHGPGGTLDHVVMADPEGNELCVV